MKKTGLIAALLLATSFASAGTTQIGNSSESSHEGTIYRNNLGSKMCVIQILEQGLLSISDIQYTDSTHDEVKSYDKDSFWISREEILESMPKSGSGNVIKSYAGSESEGHAPLKLTLTFENNELVAAKIKRSSGLIFSETTSCSLK